MEKLHCSFGRALAFCCERQSFDVGQFLNRLAWELHHALSHNVINVATLAIREDGTKEIGHSVSAPKLPIETLVGLIAEEQFPVGVCRVRDHVGDSVRFIGASFRTTILLKVPLPKVAFGGELVLWEGLAGVASREIVAEVEVVGKELARWLDVYAPVLEIHLRASVQRELSEHRIRHLLGVIHDVRAPVGIMKLLLDEVLSTSPERRELVDSLLREVRYVEQIASQCAPGFSDGESAGKTTDVSSVIRRVVGRIETDPSLDVDIEAKNSYQRYIARAKEIDIERVLTNVVGNAARHARTGRVVVECEPDGEWIAIVVKDNGPGISRGVAEQINRGDVSPIASVSGWGVGLLSCKNLIESKGGQFFVRPGAESGTVVEIRVPLQGRIEENEPALRVAEPSFRRDVSPECGAVCVVDDDGEHNSSLVRVLRSRGISATAFADLKSFLSSGALTPSSVILCDAHMPGGGVESLLGLLRARSLKPHVAAMSGDTSEDLLYKVSALGARGFFEKPVRLEELLDWIEHAHAQMSLARGSS